MGREAMVKVKVSRTIQEKPYHPFSVEVEFEGSIVTETERISKAKELYKEATAFVDGAIIKRRNENA